MAKIFGGTAVGAFFLALLASMPVSAAPGDIFMTPAKATIDIDAEGRVEDVVLSGVPGEDATRIFREQIRQWRFEPVLEEGGPVAARAYAEMDVYVVEDDEGALHLSVGRPTFRSPPGEERELQASTAPDRLELIEQVQRRVPKYPSGMARCGIEANVVLLAEIAPSGEVARLGVASAYFMNPPSDGVSDRAMNQFVAAAKAAVGHWRFNPSTSERREALVPIRFFMRTTDVEAWQRIQPLRDARETWVADRLQGRAGSATAVADLESDTNRFVLLNPPDLPWL